MLTLVNIIKNNSTIEADYIPESTEMKAHVKLDFLSDNYEAEEISEYGAMYGAMALRGLRRILAELDNGIINMVPKEKTVMWY